MKVLFFDFATHFGGSRQSTLLLADELKKHCEVYIADAYGTCIPYLNALNRSGIQYFVVQPQARYSYVGHYDSPLLRTIKVLKSMPEMICLIDKMRKIIKHIEPDVISVNGYKSLFFTARAIDNKIPITYYVRGERLYPKWYLKHDWKKLSLVIANSEAGLSRLRYSPYKMTPMEVLHNGIDLEDFRKLAMAPAPDLPAKRGLSILCAATLYKGKDQVTCINGFAQYVHKGGNASLWLAGDEPTGSVDDYQNKLKNLINKLGVADRVHFLGWREDLPAVIRQCDILVLTSLSEGLPRIIMEAMYLKKPVVATRVGGVPELINDGIEGFLVETGDSGAVANALEMLVNPHSRKKMGQKGFERAKANFDIRIIAERYYKLVKNICRTQ